MPLNPGNFVFPVQNLGPDFGKFIGAFNEQQKRGEESRLNEAEINRAPFRNLQGPAAQAFAVYQLEQQLGAEHPVVQEAKKLQSLDQRNTESQIRNRDILSETAPKRFSTGVTKTQLELEEAMQGFMPGSNGTIPLDQQQQQALVGRLQNKMIKDTTDTQARQRTLFASNIDKTLASFDPKDLVQYAGLGGKLSEKIQAGKALTGNENKEYQNYQKALTSAALLAGQIRQFYGESIQPAMREHLEQLVNPSTWANNPELALAQFNQLRDVLLSETETYKNALKGPGEYAGHPAEDNERAKAKQAFNPKKTVHMKVNGQSYAIPLDRVEDFMNAHKDAYRAE